MTPPPSTAAATDVQPQAGKAKQDIPLAPASPSPDLFSTPILASPAIRSALSSLCSALLDAAITPWWSRLSPTNEPALHDEAERLVSLVGSELARRVEEAEREGRLGCLLREELPALLGRYIEVWRGTQLGLEADGNGEQGIRIGSTFGSGSGVFEDDEGRASRRFEVYTALWPSVYVSFSPSPSSPSSPFSGPGTNPRLSHARLRSLASSLLPFLLPAEELQSRAAAALVRDLLAMLLRLSMEKGSAGWMWVRAGQKMLDRAAEKNRLGTPEGAGAGEEDIVLLPSLEEIRGAIAQGCKRALPIAQRGLQAGREYLGFPPQTPQIQTPDHPPPPSYQEKKSPPPSPAEQAKAARPASSASSNYLCLLCTLLNLPATYTGKMVQGAITLLRLFGSQKLDDLLLSTLHSHLPRESHYLSLLSTLRTTLLTAEGTLPPHSAPPTLEVQREEYEIFLVGLAREGPDLLGMGMGGEWLMSVLLSGTTIPAPSTAPAPAQPATAPRVESLRLLLDPLLSPEACWTRADLVGRVLERVLLGLVPEMARGGVSGGSDYRDRQREGAAD